MFRSELSSGYARLDRLHRRWRRRLNLLRAVRWGARGAVAGLALGVVLAAVGLGRQVLLREAYLPLLVSLTVSGAAAAALLGMVWPRSRQQSARLLDRRLGLRERLSTAVELALAGWPGSGPMPLWQLDETLRYCQGVDARSALRPPLPGRELALAALMALVALLPLRFGERAFEAAAQQAAIRQAIEAEVGRVEALQQMVSSAERLQPEARHELLQQLQRLEDELDQARSLEQAVAALVEGEGALRSWAPDSAQQAGDELRRAGASLSESRDPGLAALGQDLQEGDFRSAAERLARMELPTEDRAAALARASELEAAAESLQSAEPGLADAFRAAAEALREGDAGAAQQALASAAEALADRAQAIQQAEVAGQAADELADAQGRLLQASQLAQQGGPGQGEGAGQAEGTGAGEGSTAAGQPSTGATGAQSEADQAAAGAGRGEFQPAAGGLAGGDPIAQDNLPGDGGEVPYQPLQPSTRLGDDSGPMVTLPGSAEPGGQVVGGAAQLPRQGESRVPYAQVLAAYEAYARIAMDTLQPPAAFEALVRKYFESLAP
jgi:hypothetical protein